MFDDNSDEDWDWASEVADVTPLQKNKHHPKASTDIKPDSKDDEVESFDDIQQVYPNHNRPQEIKQSVVVDIPAARAGLLDNNEPFIDRRRELLLFCARRAGLDPKAFKQLGKGQIPYEHVIDLHGHVEDEAWASLMDFLRQGYQENCRCLLVVHGKGKGYGVQGDMGLIKSQVCTWLEGCGAVLAYHTTIPRHGGSGAVYVLLRRNKG